MKDITLDFMFKPQNYLSYRKFVKYAIRDMRPVNCVSGANSLAVVSYPHLDPNNAIIFKIDGAKVHKQLADCYIFVSPSHLFAYEKTPSEFLADWQAEHYKK